MKLLSTLKSLGPISRGELMNSAIPIRSLFVTWDSAISISFGCQVPSRNRVLRSAKLAAN